MRIYAGWRGAEGQGFGFKVVNTPEVPLVNFRVFFRLGHRALHQGHKPMDAGAGAWPLQP